MPFRRLGEKVVRPQELCFTQDSISVTFKRPREQERIDDAVDLIKWGKLSPKAFPKMNVVEFQHCLWSLDNRRLWVFKKAEVNHITVTLVAYDFGIGFHSLVSTSPYLYATLSSADFFPRIRGFCKETFLSSDDDDRELPLPVPLPPTPDYHRHGHSELARKRASVVQLRSPSPKQRPPLPSTPSPVNRKSCLTTISTVLIPQEKYTVKRSPPTPFLIDKSPPRRKAASSRPQSAPFSTDNIPPRRTAACFIPQAAPQAARTPAAAQPAPKRARIHRRSSSPKNFSYGFHSSKKSSKAPRGSTKTVASPAIKPALTPSNDPVIPSSNALPRSSTVSLILPPDFSNGGGLLSKTEMNLFNLVKQAPNGDPGLAPPRKEFSVQDTQTLDRIVDMVCSGVMNPLSPAQTVPTVDTPERKLQAQPILEDGIQVVSQRTMRSHEKKEQEKTRKEARRQKKTAKSLRTETPGFAKTTVCRNFLHDDPPKRSEKVASGVITVESGDMVYVKVNGHLSGSGTSGPKNSKRTVRRLHPYLRTMGPFEVVRKFNEHSALLELPDDCNLKPVIALKNLLKSRSPLDNYLPKTRMSITLVAETILKKRVVRRLKKQKVWHYLVKWETLPASEATWEPETIFDENPHLRDQINAPLFSNPYLLRNWRA